MILAIGSELLTPQKLDTNSLFLTERLNAHGVVVRYKLVVGDAVDDIAMAIQDAVARADLIVLSGGLGPTDDDVTRTAVARALSLPLHEDTEVVSDIRTRFESRGLEMPDINRRQAMVPEGAAILPNPHGTAPGLWIESGDVICLLLPGPPRELRPMFEQVLSARIEARTSGHRLFRRVLTIVGRTESHVEGADPAGLFTMAGFRDSQSIRRSSRHWVNSSSTCRLLLTTGTEPRVYLMPPLPSSQTCWGTVWSALMEHRWSWWSAGC